MKKAWIIILIILLAVIIFFIVNKNIINKNGLNKDINKVGDEKENKMEIKSVFNNGEKIPVKYTADGDDVNPSLEITGIPKEAKSLVLVMDDPDAPRGTWVHWILFNIPPNVNKIEENTVPVNAVQGKNSWNKNEYGGPSPPSGTHRYFFKVYALDNQLTLSENSDKNSIENAMKEHVLDKAELIGVYGR